MYVVSIRYPRKEGEQFNFDHWKSVHMPMGIGIYNRTNGFAPKQVMVQHATYGMDGKSESADAYATVWLLFDTKEGLDGFIKLHSDEIASAPLAEDFVNYAPLPPHLAFGECEILSDMDDIITRGEKIIDSLP